MFRAVADWIEERRRIRRRWQKDAREMIEIHDRRAYYEAQRLAARNRAQGNRSAFWHWAKVASEIARLSPVAEMDMTIVQAIADEEAHNHRHS
jgi:hypothetical protein